MKVKEKAQAIKIKFTSGKSYNKKEAIKYIDNAIDAAETIGVNSILDIALYYGIKKELTQS